MNAPTPPVRRRTVLAPALFLAAVAAAHAPDALSGGRVLGHDLREDRGTDEPGPPRVGRPSALETSWPPQGSIASPSTRGTPDHLGRMLDASILVVSDEPPIRGLLGRFLTDRGYRVRSGSNAAEALRFAAQSRPEMIVLDLYRSPRQELDVVRALRAEAYRGQVILLASWPDGPWLQDAAALSAVQVVRKPVDLERLAFTVQVGLALNARGWASE